MRLKNFIGAVLVMVFVLGMAFPGFSMYIGNTSEKGFDEDGTNDATTAKVQAAGNLKIEDLIIKSATYFLKGKSHVDLLASKLEAADHEGVCFYEYQIMVNDALDNMRMAHYYYQALVNKANATPYNQSVINQLRAFDYEGVAKEWGVNESSFNQIKEYLQDGDIRGAYVRLRSYTANIVNTLGIIQKDVYYWRFPDKTNIWRLNQECAQMLLFGQYMAQIFYQVD